MFIEFNRHLMTLNKFDTLQLMAMYFNRCEWICWHFQSPSRNYQMAFKFVSVVWWWPNLEEVFLGYMNFKIQFMIHFLAPLFSFGFCVFGCPFITIAWYLGWVEVIKSLVKGCLFCILWIFWTTLNLDFSKL